MHLVVSIIICNGDDFLETFITLVCFLPHSFPFHRIFQFHFVCQSCPIAQFLPQRVAQGHLRISQCELLFLLL
jgi:hypothetical protein